MKEERFDSKALKDALELYRQLGLSSKQKRETILKAAKSGAPNEDRAKVSHPETSQNTICPQE